MMTAEQQLQQFIDRGFLLDGEKVDPSTVCLTFHRHREPDNKTKDGIIFCTSHALRCYLPPDGPDAPHEYSFAYFYDQINYRTMEYHPPRPEEDTSWGLLTNDYKKREKWCWTLRVNGYELAVENGDVVRNLEYPEHTKWWAMIRTESEENFKRLWSILAVQRDHRLRPVAPPSASSNPPSPPSEEIAVLRSEIGRLQQHSTAQPEQYNCMRCGRQSPSPFKIIGDRALCPDCEKAVQKTVNLESGVIPSLAVGGKYGRYLLQERLGGGAYGEVWKALDERLGRSVALKFPKYDGGETLERLRIEAEAAGKLEHANIARIYTVEEDKGRQFIVMHYIEGTTLEAYVTKDPKDAVRIIRDVAKAVHFAHERKIIHRDLKPSNVIIDPAGNPIVTDFGLALLIEASRRLTATGTFVGTPAYAAPEQDGGPVDARADVYALGVVLYELITDALPPSGSTAQSQAWKPFPAEVPGLEAIVKKCLRRKPEDRYTTSDALAQALDEILTPRRTTEPALPPEFPIQVIETMADQAPGIHPPLSILFGFKTLDLGGGKLHRYALTASISIGRAPAPDRMRLELSWPNAIRISRIEGVGEGEQKRHEGRLYRSLQVDVNRSAFPGENLQVIGPGAAAHLEYEFDDRTHTELHERPANLHYTLFVSNGEPFPGRVPFAQLNEF